MTVDDAKKRYEASVASLEQAQKNCRTFIDGLSQILNGQTMYYEDLMEVLYGAIEGIDLSPFSLHIENARISDIHAIDRSYGIPFEVHTPDHRHTIVIGIIPDGAEKALTLVTIRKPKESLI